MKIGWNFRLVEFCHGGHTWVEVREVFYDSEGNPVAHSSPCLGSETVEDAILNLEQMLKSCKGQPALIESSGSLTVKQPLQKP